MIIERLLHVELHRGYRPRVSFRRVLKAGDRMVNGHEPGVLVLCPRCSGDGTLHVPDDPPASTWPTRPAFPPLNPPPSAEEERWLRE